MYEISYQDCIFIPKKFYERYWISHHTRYHLHWYCPSRSCLWDFGKTEIPLVAVTQCVEAVKGPDMRDILWASAQAGLYLKKKNLCAEVMANCGDEWITLYVSAAVTKYTHWAEPPLHIPCHLLVNAYFGHPPLVRSFLKLFIMYTFINGLSFYCLYFQTFFTTSTCMILQKKAIRTFSH